MISTQRDVRVDDTSRRRSIQVEFVTLATASISAELREHLGAFQSFDPIPNAMQQSTDWLGHLFATERDTRVVVAIVRENAVVLAATPVAIVPYELQFRVGLRVLWKTDLRLIEILGGVPAIPDSDEAVAAFVTAASKEFGDVDGLHASLIPVTSGFWNRLRSLSILRSHLLYVPDGACHTHFVDLPKSFDDYLGKFSAKTRYNLRRNIKVLETEYGAVALHRFETPDEAAQFVVAAAPVAEASWQTDDRVADTPFWRHKLADLAERGLLRSYVLSAGGAPCAFVYGCQHEGVFHYIQPGYDPRFARSSPGTVLLYLIIRDLIEHRSATCLHFGHGHIDYKAFFGTRTSLDAEALLLRKTVRNRILVNAHHSFRAGVRFLKRRLRRDRKG